jgi:hypothetical protein
LILSQADHRFIGDFCKGMLGGERKGDSTQMVNQRLPSAVFLCSVKGGLITFVIDETVVQYLPRFSDLDARFGRLLVRFEGSRNGRLLSLILPPPAIFADPLIQVLLFLFLLAGKEHRFTPFLDGFSAKAPQAGVDPTGEPGSASSPNLEAIHPDRWPLLPFWFVSVPPGHSI